MTLVLLDTNAYLRLAKRIIPLLGVPFGQKNYALTVLTDVEKEVHRSSRLKYHYPWFDDEQFHQERVAKRVRLSTDERAQIEAMTSVLRAYVVENAISYSSHSRSPPSDTDCFCLAFGQIRPAIVATDDLGMHQLAKEFEIPVFHCHEVLHKMLSARAIDKEMVADIYNSLEINGDLPLSWRQVKHTSFKKIFGSRPRSS